MIRFKQIIMEYIQGELCWIIMFDQWCAGRKLTCWRKEEEAIYIIKWRAYSCSGQDNGNSIFVAHSFIDLFHAEARNYSGAEVNNSRGALVSRTNPAVAVNTQTKQFLIKTNLI